MKNALIYFYDDLCLIDDSESVYDDKDQLAKVVESMLRSVQGAVTAEVYDSSSKKMILHFRLTQKGNIKKLRTDRRGGKRPGAGRPKKENANVEIVMFRTSEEMKEFLFSLENKSEFIRQAIQEKRDREYQQGQS